MVKVVSSVGTSGARRLTQGQSIAEAAHIATMVERERCARACELLPNTNPCVAVYASRIFAAAIRKGKKCR